jgi:hypothetical protein
MPRWLRAFPPALCASGPAEAVRRYGCDKPGELIHFGIKELGKFERIVHCITP